mgnify:CR=1 FL=1
MGSDWARCAKGGHGCTARGPPGAGSIGLERRGSGPSAVGQLQFDAPVFRIGLGRVGRIERLERTGHIVGYTVRVADEHERGQLKAFVMVTLQPRQSASIEVALRRMPEVRALHSVSGPFDLIVSVTAASVEAMNATIDRIGALDGVERTTSAVVLSTRIDR